MPNVILEAMSVGVPVIASRVAAIPEMVEHGRTGFLVDPGDPGQIADCLQEMLSDSRLRRGMSRNCIREAGKYSWESVIKDLGNIYKRLGVA